MKYRFLSLLLVIPLASCNAVDPSEYKDEVFLGRPFINFDGNQDDYLKYEIKNGYTNGNIFLTYWSRQSVSLSDSIAKIDLYDENGKNYGAEISTRWDGEHYLYGYYGARIKSFKKAGTVQSVFTYNGGSYEWDEIDIEILGKDTTKVQFNYFDNGVGGHEHVHDLGFDGSLDFHDYGFKWEEDKITWFIDFVPVYQVKARLNQWGRFFINVWAGKNEQTESWLGRYEPSETKMTAYYDYMSYAPLEA